MNKRELAEALFNRLATAIPSNRARCAYLRKLGASIGPNTYLFGGCQVQSPDGLLIAGNCHVGRFSLLDARGGLTIGSNVVIAGYCCLLTADHDPQSTDFRGRVAPIVIGDRAWLGTRSTVLKGVSIGPGAVVAAGSVVTSDVAPFSIVAGVPARKVGDRNEHQTYEIDYGPSY